MKDYHINIFKGENESGNIIVTQDINRRGTDYLVKDWKNGWKKRYILEVGDKAVDIFGNIVTIKEIIHHESTKTSNFLVEENGNTYCPNEIAGIYIKHLSQEEFESFIKQ